MEDILITIMERIAQEVPELSHIDEDYGQLEFNEDTYPVTFPCVLIGNIDSDWDDIGMGAQNSETTITTRLAIDCYDDTHYSSGTHEKIRERIQLVKKVYKALQCFEPTDNTSELVRIKSRDYSISGGIKVYETTYEFTIHDESAMD